jgi:dethiobiotin synthetase
VRGVSIVGTSTDADEGAVAQATCAALRDVGETPAAERLGPDGAATPYVAARHAGAALEPQELIARLRTTDAPVVLATAGGALAPLTERYTVRDLLRELGLPVVVAAAAGPDLVNHTRLTVAAVRGVGVPVADVVVTGWPETPSRVLLDERALLGRSRLLGDELPVAEWLAAAAESEPGADVTMEAYDEWEPRRVGDPRSAPRAEIMAALEAIVAAEGPMRASRAYALYNRAAGGRKLTSVARAPLSSALYWLARDRRVVLTRADDIPWQQDDVVRLPDTPAVRVRELGSRTLEEVPLDEIAELIRRVRGAGGTHDPHALKRAVLDAYGLVRLTARADEYLGLALDLSDG